MKDSIAIMAMCATSLLATPCFASGGEISNRPEQSASSLPPGMETSINSVQEEMARLFNGFSNSHAFGVSQPLLAPTPAADVVNSSNEVYVTFSLPGVALNDIDAEVIDGRLIVRSSKDEEIRHETKNCIGQESAVSAFEREIQLPDTADVNNAMAVYKNGLLTVTLPKSAEARPLSRRLAIIPAS